MADDILAGLFGAIDHYDATAAVEWARKSVEAGIDPVEAFDAMTAVMSNNGDEFGSVGVSHEQSGARLT